ncbi:MAG: phenylalanine--tRNA ligase subunit beta [Chlamydiota bacterium]|nr:phenylalanine--tRNA ligase subunit beta [Chlamydiota bacterium]
MKVPLSWLKDYVDTTLPPIEIAKILTMAGLEVDAIECKDLGFTDVVVGEVLETEPHPNADKLCLAKVTDGNEIHHVVCGAPNCRQGIKTALAKVGASLPDDGEKPFKVKKSKIRGCESSGMLCSWKELKISDDNDGIIELADDVELGTDLAELYRDHIFEISLTPNLGHCANIIGVARELHASTEEPLCLPKVQMKESDKEKIEGQATVEIKDFSLCPRYACRLIKNVTMGPSPQWMQNRLISSGIRPINNIVDITNYVLLEMGHPLHAFDYDHIDGGKIIVRPSKEGEKFVTLDEKERQIPEGALLICDENKPVAIAGVMGGQNSEVGENTKNVLLESAYFAPSSIRKTSKKLGLMTDASRRFERGCDPNMVEAALDRASMLISEIAKGEITKGIIDVKEGEFKEKIVECRVSRTNKLLGTQLVGGEIESIFQRLGFKFTWDGEDTFSVTIPTYRVDISQEVDLIEEVARLYGFDNLHQPISAFHNSKLPHSEVFLFEREIRARMVSEGLQEFMTCDLIGPSLLEIVHGSEMNKEALVEVLNPTSIEQSCLRTSLLPGILQVVKYNCDHQNSDIAGFEVGRVHFKKGEDQYHEETVVGIVLTGKVHPDNWDEKPREVDFYDLKGVVENMLEEFGVTASMYKNNRLSVFHTGRQASVYVGELEIGSIGEVHPGITRKLGVSQRIFFAEFNLQDIFKCRRDNHQMQPIPIYPSSERDWTMTLKEGVAMSDVFKIIDSIDSRLLEDYQVRDIYRSSKLGDGLKNVTLRFVYRDKKKTISQEAVDREHARITDKTRSLITI